MVFYDSPLKRVHLYWMGVNDLTQASLPSPLKLTTRLGRGQRKRERERGRGQRGGKLRVNIIGILSGNHVARTQAECFVYPLSHLVTLELQLCFQPKTTS